MHRFDLSQDSRAILASGISEPSVPAITAGLLEAYPGRVAILLDKTVKAAEQWAEDLAFYHRAMGHQPDLQLISLPDLPEFDSGDDPRIFEILCDRLSVLSNLMSLRETPYTDGPVFVIATTPAAFFSALPPVESMADSMHILKRGDQYNFQKLADSLAGDLDYDSEVVCEQPGQFAVRGGLIDVYPLNAHQPYRLDFFGDEIESIRTFDPTTQRTESQVDRVELLPGRQDNSKDRKGALVQYLPDSVIWLLREPGDLEYERPDLFQYPEKKGIPSGGFESARHRRNGEKDRWIGLLDVDPGNTIFHEPGTGLQFESEPLANYRRFPRESEIGLDRYESEQSARRQFLQQLLDWQREGYTVWLVSHNKGEESRLLEILESDPVLKQLKPVCHSGQLHQGFKLPLPSDGASLFPQINPLGSGWIVATDSEIFGRYRRRLNRLQTRRLPERTQVDQLLDFSELADGDPVVHLQNGICLFRGLTKVDVQGVPREMISLEFAAGAMLHVPLHESHLLSRYVGLTKSEPKLAKLGSNSWDKTRAAAEKATLDFAAELLNLQARRESAEGHAFDLEHKWLSEFEDSFIFKETPDQITAIGNTKEDMALPRPMDRLICGDVGFGKTEVALRAAFLAVLNGKQVALLVPTTVLCQQHYNTFKERLADYPVVVEMVSRFRSTAQNRKILRETVEGSVDILIGTHRMLSEDVKFHQLGLYVIDEEQRFGVRQKERLKALKAHVDVLAMSATPIPRTLYLALVGARDMSVIETPPRDRLPIQTIVKQYDPNLVKGAIEQETNRGGQVFYLHNRVQTIQRVAADLEKWFPKLNIAVGHGQMDEMLLERIMTDFVAGKYHVLVCTTIIESGIDIPNCNTMIIEGADRFGLAQLYQLRGRVGRFKRQAYCYLLLHQKTHLKDQARKRLASIRQYNQLGAGFRIAMRDLELRGAGNLLGAEQSGHIAGVGFDLYCQLLRQSIARLKGEPGADRIRPSLRIDFIVTGESSVESGANRTTGNQKGGFSELKAGQLESEKIKKMPVYLPDDYISESRLRIDFYRHLAMAPSLEELNKVKDALIDRFGPLPEPAEGLLLVTEIRILAEQKQLNSVETEGNRLKLKIARANTDTFVKMGPRFPRLSRRKPLSRLREIRSFLQQLPESPCQ